jgi:hypothetical protein
MPIFLNKGDTFIICDVSQLYPSIDNKLGYVALKYWMEKYLSYLKGVKKEFVISAMRIILERNCFRFRAEYFLQLKGTSMGTKVAPVYANLVMGYLEDKLMDRMKTLSSSFSCFLGKRYFRFLDDVIIFWTSKLGKAELFLQRLNDMHKDIRFGSNISSDTVNFLDLRLVKCGDFILTDIYHKDTDSRNYIHFNSCHPSHL